MATLVVPNLPHEMLFVKVDHLHIKNSQQHHHIGQPKSQNQIGRSTAAVPTITAAAVSQAAELF